MSKPRIDCILNAPLTHECGAELSDRYFQIRDGGVAGTEKGESAIKGLLDHVKATSPTALADIINSSLEFNEAVRNELKEYFA